MTEQTKSIRRSKNTYKTSSGELVPGVTTILALRAKPALVNWAFKIARENPTLSSINAYVDDLATIGSCAHHILDSHFKNVDPDLGDYTPNDVQVAKNSVRKYWEWANGKEIEVLEADTEMVSDAWRFGGKLDLYAKIDGRFTVLDLKTGKAIYDEHVMQCAAYAELLREQGKQVDEVRILQIGRSEAEGFTERVVGDWQNYWLAFLALRQLYDVELAIKQGVKWVPHLRVVA